MGEVVGYQRGMEYENYDYQTDIALVLATAVPAPSSLVLLLTTLLAVAFVARKRIVHSGGKTVHSRP